LEEKGKEREPTGQWEGNSKPTIIGKVWWDLKGEQQIETKKRRKKAEIGGKNGKQEGKTHRGGGGPEKHSPEAAGPSSRRRGNRAGDTKTKEGGGTKRHHGFSGPDFCREMLKKKGTARNTTKEASAEKGRRKNLKGGVYQSQCSGRPTEKNGKARKKPQPGQGGRKARAFKFQPLQKKKRSVGGKWEKKRKKTTVRKLKKKKTNSKNKKKVPEVGTAPKNGPRRGKRDPTLGQAQSGKIGEAV